MTRHVDAEVPRLLSKRGAEFALYLRASVSTILDFAGLAADALDALRAFRSAPDIAAMAGRAWPDAQAVSREARALRRAAEAGAARYDSRRWVGGGRDR